MTARVLRNKASIGLSGSQAAFTGPIDPSAVYRRLQDTGRSHRPGWMIAAPVVVVLIGASVLIYATSSKTPATEPATATASPCRCGYRPRPRFWQPGMRAFRRCGARASLQVSRPQK